MVMVTNKLYYYKENLYKNGVGFALLFLKWEVVLHLFNFVYKFFRRLFFYFGQNLPVDSVSTKVGLNENDRSKYSTPKFLAKIHRYCVCKTR
jgi:hypothetical protein